MKIVEHPNIVNLVEVIDDPTTDHFYMGTHFLTLSQSLLYTHTHTHTHAHSLFRLKRTWHTNATSLSKSYLLFWSVLEYIDGKWDWEGSSPPGSCGEIAARKYFRDVVSGLMYLHAHV